MPFEDYSAYLIRVDVWLAIFVAVAGVAVAILVYMFLQAALDDLLNALPHVGERVGKAIRTRHQARSPEWVCRECRSINATTSSWCYRGCGSRYLLEDRRVDPRQAMQPDDSGRDGLKA